MSASAALPVLISLGKILAQYGPLVVNFLIESGLLKLPAGATLPPLAPIPGAAADPVRLAELHAIRAELDLDGLAGHSEELKRLYADAKSGIFSPTAS
jgi:hypothetical protein